MHSEREREKIIFTLGRHSDDIPALCRVLQRLREGSNIAIITVRYVVRRALGGVTRGPLWILLTIR